MLASIMFTCTVHTVHWTMQSLHTALSVQHIETQVWHISTTGNYIYQVNNKESVDAFIIRYLN